MKSHARVTNICKVCLGIFVISMTKVKQKVILMIKTNKSEEFADVEFNLFVSCWKERWR